MGAWRSEREGPVAVLTLRWPPVNALDRAGLDELDAALAAVEGDRAVRALVIRSGLPSVFCSGGDLRYWSRFPDSQDVSGAGRRVLGRLTRLAVPTIAALHGHVVGDGLTLALASDLRLAADDTVVRMPEVAYGFIPGWGPIAPLVALVGRGHAAGLLLAGDAFDAARAAAIGLVNEVVDRPRLDDRALERARDLARLSPAAVAAARCALRGGDERACFEQVWGGPEWAEGLAAFLDRRPPAFAGVAEGGAPHGVAGGLQEARAACGGGCQR